MAKHYVYDDPDAATLQQGDVLKRTAALAQVLSQDHPQFAANQENLYFLILTQGCDLVRRDGGLPSCACINLAAVRPISSILRTEAIKYQPHDWMTGQKVVSKKDGDKLLLLVQRLLDNNQAGYFYLHADADCQIFENYCAILAVSVPLDVEHYNTCLGAKVAQLKEPFQAKLGYLIAELYGRVGTTEWDSAHLEKSVRTTASEILRGVFAILDDDRIKDGLSELKAKGTLDAISAEETFLYIKNRKPVPKTKQFNERARRIMADGFVEVNKMLKGRLRSAFKADKSVRSAIVGEINESENMAATELAETIILHVARRIEDIASDSEAIGRDAIVDILLRVLMQDAVIKNLLQ